MTGAGPAGLTAAAELSPVAIPDIVPGQADSAGASWRGRYDRLRLNTCRRTSRLAPSRYPAHTALFLSCDDMVGYLEDYPVPGVRVGTRVERIDRHQAGRGAKPTAWAGLHTRAPGPVHGLGDILISRRQARKPRASSLGLPSLSARSACSTRLRQ